MQQHPIPRNAILAVTRPNGWFGRFRRLKVLVDGELRAMLRCGETAHIRETAGRHEVQVRMDWCTSRMFAVDCAEGTTTELQCEHPSIWRLHRATFVTPRDAFGLTLTRITPGVGGGVNATSRERPPTAASR